MKHPKLIKRLLFIPTILGVISPVLYLLRKFLIEQGNALYPLPGIIIRLNQLIPWVLLMISFARFNSLISTSSATNRRRYSKLESLLLLITFVVYTLLHYFNQYSHANYSYSLMGAPFDHVAQFAWLTLASLVLGPSSKYWVTFYKDLKNEKNAHKYNLKFSKLTQGVFLIIIFFQLISITLTLPNSVKVKLNPNAIFASKQQVVDELIKLPSESVIVHPPQDSRWPALSNQIILRYYLFPRTLVSGEIEGLRDAPPLQSEFYLIQSRNPALNQTWPDSIESWLETTFGQDTTLYSIFTIWQGTNDTIYKIVRGDN